MRNLIWTLSNIIRQRPSPSEEVQNEVGVQFQRVFPFIKNEDNLIDVTWALCKLTE